MRQFSSRANRLGPPYIGIPPYSDRLVGGPLPYLTDANRLSPDKMSASFASKPSSPPPPPPPPPPRCPGKEAVLPAGDDGEITPIIDSCVHAESARRSLRRTLSLLLRGGSRSGIWGSSTGCSDYSGIILTTSVQMVSVQTVPPT